MKHYRNWSVGHSSGIARRGGWGIGTGMREVKFWNTCSDASGIAYFVLFIT